jgi:hypothetical protein
VRVVGVESFSRRAVAVYARTPLFSTQGEKCLFFRVLVCVTY